MPAANKHRSGKAGGNRAPQRSGKAGGRSGRPTGTIRPAVDQFGLATNSKYRTLGPRNRQNVGLAIDEGFIYARTSRTTEEQCCYGEFRRRGFAYGLKGNGRWFIDQYPLAGSIVDFYGEVDGAAFVLRPMNHYWHGHATELYSDTIDVQKLLAHVSALYDIWDGDSLVDEGIRSRFDLFFGVG